MNIRTFTTSIFLFTCYCQNLPAVGDTFTSPPSGFVLPEPASGYEQTVLNDVKELGWHTVIVQPEGDKPGYAYSLGFYANHGRPEIIVLGLAPPLAQQFLNAAAGGATYETYRPYDNIIPGRRIAFVSVAKQNIPGYFGYGAWFYQSVKGTFPALQLVWSDRQGLLPWEKGFDASYTWLQPLLDK